MAPREEPPGGLNAFYWYQIFPLDSAVVEVQEMFSWHGSLLTIAMYHHGETLSTRDWFIQVKLAYTSMVHEQYSYTLLMK